MLRIIAPKEVEAAWVLLIPADLVITSYIVRKNSNLARKFRILSVIITIPAWEDSLVNKAEFALLENSSQIRKKTDIM